MALLKPDRLDHDQKKLYDGLQEKMVSWGNVSGFQADTAEGELIGPFNPMLYSPKPSEALMGFLGAEKENTALSATVREVVILTTGAVWKCAYELYAHTAVGRKAGLGQDVINELVAGRTPETLEIDESIAHEFTRALVADYKVDHELYLRTVETFGEKGTVDMIYLAGTYMTVSGLLTTFDVPAPAGKDEDD